jgi:endonuclease/exonuclease/phosphatase family metal-dependent hydrolase
MSGVLKLKLVARPIRGIEWAIRGTVGGRAKLGIVAIWACAPESHDRYIRQVHKLLDQGILKALPPRSMFLGDFNSNKIWDGKHRERSHTRVVEKFDVAGFRSAYHDLLKEEQGKESTPTFFLQRLRRKPYHIDYAFLSSTIRQDLKKLNIGKPATWLKISDHMPFSIEFRRQERLTSG